jgi:L-rhamnose mutarotase
MSAGIASPAELSTECFVYELAPGQGARYDELHRDVWPEVLQSLTTRSIGAVIW